MHIATVQDSAEKRQLLAVMPEQQGAANQLSVREQTLLHFKRFLPQLSPRRPLIRLIFAFLTIISSHEKLFRKFNPIRKTSFN